MLMCSIPAGAAADKYLQDHGHGDLAAAIAGSWQCRPLVISAPLASTSVSFVVFTHRLFSAKRRRKTGDAGSHASSEEASAVLTAAGSKAISRTGSAKQARHWSS